MRHATISVVAFGIACAVSAQTSPPAPTQQQRQQDLKGAEKTQRRDDSPPMTAARTKKLADLSAVELVGQRDDMRSETAAQSAQLKAEADAAKAKWDKMTPAEKQAVRKSAWQKRRAELDGVEAVGQRDDSYVLPFQRGDIS